jgi:hypothetical protein
MAIRAFLLSSLLGVAHALSYLPVMNTRTLNVHTTFDHRDEQPTPATRLLLANQDFHTAPMSKRPCGTCATCSCGKANAKSRAPIARMSLTPDWETSQVQVHSEYLERLRLQE